MRNFALAAYPLSGALRAELERETGAPVEILVLPQLRRLSIPALGAGCARWKGAAYPARGPLERSSAPDSRDARGGHPGEDDRDRSRGRHAWTRLAAAKPRASGLTARRERGLPGCAAGGAARPRPAPPRRRNDPVLAGERILFSTPTSGSASRPAGRSPTSRVANALAGRGYEFVLATAPEPVGVTQEATVRRLRPPRTYGLPVRATSTASAAAVGSSRICRSHGSSTSGTRSAVTRAPSPPAGPGCRSVSSTTAPRSGWRATRVGRSATNSSRSMQRRRACGTRASS